MHPNTNSRRRRVRFLSEAKTYTDIPSFLGLDKLINKNNTPAQKILWSFALCVSFTLTMWQVSLCLSKYIEEPIGTEVSVEISKTFSLPAITLCPSSKYLGYDFDEPFQKICGRDQVCKHLNSTERLTYPFKKLKIDLLHLWLDKQIKFKVDVKCDYIVNSSYCEEMIKSTPEYYNTTTGECQVFTNVNDVLWYFIGKTIWPLVFIEEVSTEVTDYFVDTSVHHTDFVEILFVGYQTMKRDEINRLEVDIVDFHFLNTTKNPCTTPEENIHCNHKCFQDTFMNIKPECKWPFLQSDLPWCNTMLEINNFRKQIIQVRHLLKYCKCSRPCDFVFFTTSVTNYYKTNATVIAMVLNSDKKQVVKEFYIYKFTSCVSDLGGSIGIFLGISLLSCLEFFHALAKKILAKAF